ncbi:MAG: hypothetical protein LV480_03050, partial [Methylacidiphilales bacterium]|nr:hypothetical protein [Candidatus Methylacidiphilales bacterium]
MKFTNPRHFVERVACLSGCLGLLALGSVAALADDAATTPAPTDPKDMKQVKAPAEKPPTPVTCRI